MTLLKFKLPGSSCTQASSWKLGGAFSMCSCCANIRFFVLHFHSEGDQPWDFFGRNDAEAETPVLWPPHAACCNSWGCKELDTTEQLSWTEMNWWYAKDNSKWKKKKQVQNQGTNLILPQAYISHHLSEPPYSLLMSRNHGIRIFFVHIYSNPGRITVNRILRNNIFFISVWRIMMK